jgi:hypothetical protein
MYFIQTQWLYFRDLELRSACVSTSDAAIIYSAFRNNAVEFSHNIQSTFAAMTLLSAVYPANMLVTVRCETH